MDLLSFFFLSLTQVTVLLLTQPTMMRARYVYRAAEMRRRLEYACEHVDTVTSVVKQDPELQALDAFFATTLSKPPSSSKKMMMANMHHHRHPAPNDRSKADAAMMPMTVTNGAPPAKFIPTKPAPSKDKRANHRDATPRMKRTTTKPSMNTTKRSMRDATTYASICRDRWQETLPHGDLLTYEEHLLYNSNTSGTHSVSTNGVTSLTLEARTAKFNCLIKGLSRIEPVDMDLVDVIRASSTDGDNDGKKDQYCFMPRH
jgi:hypothetical protein